MAAWCSAGAPGLRTGRSSASTRSGSGTTAPWQLLWRLANRARLGAAVGCRDLYDDGVVDSTVHNRWRRLKALLPPTLAREVEPGTERATYRLKLGAAQIHLFPAGPEERPAGAEGTTA